MKDFINIKPWKQFYDLKDRAEIPLSYADFITMRNCNCTCTNFFNVQADRSQYLLSNFCLKNLNVQARVDGYAADLLESISLDNVKITILE